MRELPPGFEHYNDVLYDIEKRFTVKSLKGVCQRAGLPISGAKGLLQQRLRNFFEGLVMKQDNSRFNLVKLAVEEERGYPYGGQRASRPNGIHSSGASTAATSSTSNWGLSPLYQNIRLPVFKKMPFYNLLTNVTQAYNIQQCPSSRATQPIQLRLTSEMIAKLTPKLPDNSHRLVLFCTLTDRVHFGNCVVEFPSHAEIRCNGTVVNANLRGLKNKPGTVNPPDITAQAILMQGVTNKVDVTFAESKASYTAVIYLVEKNTVQQLVDKVRRRGFSPKETTLNRMRAAAQDSDVVVGPETLTLKDPISMTRIDLPCKSKFCGHTACFDIATFLTMNEQTPTWMCPICNRSISSDDDLYLDGFAHSRDVLNGRYFYDILQNTNRAVESVVIHPDGTWMNKDIDTDHPDAKLLSNDVRPTIVAEDRKLSFGAPRPEVVSLDEDEEENGVPTPASLSSIPTRAPSISVRPSPSQGLAPRKRGLPQVVDLTLSDDEDNPPTISRLVRPPSPKRVRTNPASSSQRTSFGTNGLNRLSSMLNGVSPLSTSSIRESHIRSPPSSTSPHNEPTHNNVFIFGQSPTTLDSQPTFPQFNTFPQPTLPTLPSFSQSRPSLLTPSLPRIYSTPSFQSTDRTQSPRPPRSHSASPVLPAFSPPKSRFNSMARFDWDVFRDNTPRSPARAWDEGRDDYDNEELDSEMARLPSSMFDADMRQDVDSDGF